MKSSHCIDKNLLVTKKVVYTVDICGTTHC